MASDEEVVDEKLTKKLDGNQSRGKKTTEAHSLSSVQLSKEQFSELIKRLATISSKNFVPCTIRFHGENDENKVEEFIIINDLKLYKKMESISNGKALMDLPLLLKDKASDWWRRVRGEIKTWSSALKSISAAFSPQKQPHNIYIKLFGTPQGKEESIDDFFCRKRLLLGALQAKRHKEDEQIDLIYGLLRLELKRHIARSDVTTFADFTEKARHQDALTGLKSSANPCTSTALQEQSTRNFLRCTNCSKRGHMMEVCRKRPAKVDSNDDNGDYVHVFKPAVTRYGCGAVKVFRSNCFNCNNKEKPPKPAAFYNIETTREVHAKIPTIEVSVPDQTGYAYIDTAARTSVAGEHLYLLLKQKGVQFEEKTAKISLADGLVSKSKLLTTTTSIIIGNRQKLVTFLVNPDAIENRTLLGIDFLESKKKRCAIFSNGQGNKNNCLQWQIRHRH